ncbi:MAG: hypothetical protein R2877_07405 [Bdellovibrionota bacterium]
MKKAFSVFLILTGFVLLSCGGGDTITRDDESSAPTTTLAILNSLNSTPENGNGLITITSVSSDINPAGGDQVIHISGTTGPDDAKILHQIDIHYHLYFVGGDTLGEIDIITHTWGTTLSQSIDGGISVCESNCNNTVIHPTLNTVIFSGQVLDTTANVNTLDGTIVYPSSNATPVE